MIPLSFIFANSEAICQLLSSRPLLLDDLIYAFGGLGTVAFNKHSDYWAKNPAFLSFPP